MSVHITPQWQDVSGGFRRVGIAARDHSGHPVEARKRITAGRPADNDNGELLMLTSTSLSLPVGIGKRLWLKVAGTTQFNAQIELLDVESPPTHPGTPGFIVPDRESLADEPISHAYVYLGEEGREGWFRWDGDNLSAAVALDPYQGVYVPGGGSTTGANGAWVRVRDRTFVNIEWFGAKEWSFGDFTANIQAAIDFAGAERGECYVPAKTYKHSATLQVKHGMWLHGSGNWEDAYSTLGSGASGFGSRLMWTDATVSGAADMMQLLIESSPQGTLLQHCRTSDLIFDGNAKAGYGPWQSRAMLPVLERIHSEGHIRADIAIRPRGGNSVGPIWDQLFTNSRTDPACSAANGLEIHATTTGHNTGGQGGYGRFSGQVDGTGWGIILGNQDVYAIQKCEFFGYGGGGYFNQARAIYFRYDSTLEGSPSRKHTVTVFGGGIIKTDPGCIGIEIKGASEGFHLDLAPGSQLNVTGVQDGVSGERFLSHSFKLTDEVDLYPAAAALSGAATSTLGGYPVVAFADAASDSATWSRLGRVDWNHGQIVGLRLVYGASTADPGNEYRVQVDLRCPRANGAGLLTGTIEFQTTESFTIDAPAVADQLYRAELNLAVPAGFKRRCALTLALTRLGTDALDTSTTSLKLWGVELLYKADGPNENQGEQPHSEHGRWETGEWLLTTEEPGYYDYIGGAYPLALPAAFEAETTTLLAAMVPTPYQFQAARINEAIKALKDAGLWTLLDFFYATAASYQQHSMLNWKNPAANPLVVTGTPTWFRNDGWRGGTASHLANGLLWSGLSNFQQNSAHVAAFVLIDAQTSAGVFGTETSVNIVLSPRTATDTVSARLNTVTAGSIANLDSRGCFVLNRTGAANFDIWIRGALVLTKAAVSSAVPAEQVRVLRGSASVNNLHHVSAFCAGSGLTTAQAQALSRIISYYVGHLRS